MRIWKKMIFIYFLCITLSNNTLFVSKKLPQLVGPGFLSSPMSLLKVFFFTLKIETELQNSKLFKSYNVIKRSLILLGHSVCWKCSLPLTFMETWAVIDNIWVIESFWRQVHYNDVASYQKVSEKVFAWM